MPQLNAQLLLIALFAPLCGAAIVGFVGSRFASHLLSRKAGMLLTVSGVAVSFVCSAIALLNVMDGASFNQSLYCWMHVADIRIEIGFMVDSLSAMMMTVVTFISLLVHIYSMGYMDDDDNICRFFAYISLFTFSMLALVMGNNFLLLFFGWEGVGVMSYLLIGFWLDKPSAVSAGLKAFLVNRVGDLGFVLGVGLIFAYCRSLNYTDVFAMKSQFVDAMLPGTNMLVVTAICLLLFVGAMGKSAQFPLHVWLPDSMEGPTPISALIHAATMVTAGIFMVARLSPLYEMSNTALSVMIVVGAISALLLGFVAMVQRDIKRIIAFSTLSQLGYMVVGLGASAYAASVFHLMTHAFFKALLFLAAGSVILAMHHDQDTKHMGGLWRSMPVTYVTAFIGALALAGAPFFSGFYSKESLVAMARASTVSGSGFAAVCLIAGLFVTGFYTFRFLFIVFHGRKRYERVQMAHRSDSHAVHECLPYGEKPQESPKTMVVPLILLAIPSLVIGFIAVEPMLVGHYFNGVIFTDAVLHQAVTVWQTHFTGALAMTLHEMMAPGFWLAVIGACVAWWFYVKNPVLPVKLARRFRFLHRLLSEQYYLNTLYQKIIVENVIRLGRCLWQWVDQALIDKLIIDMICVKGVMRLAQGLWRFGDRFVIDGFIVNGCARFVGWVSSIVRHFQTGLVYHYVLAMLVGVLCLLTWFIPMSLK